jgi:hypothetical protein
MNPVSPKFGGVQSGWLARLMDRLFPEVGGEIEVRIGENARGGFSIFPVNAAARELFSAPGESSETAAEVGNFGSYADAYRRASRDNCWTVVGDVSPAPECALGRGDVAPAAFIR